MEASPLAIQVLVHLLPDHLNFFSTPSTYDMHSFILNSIHLSIYNTLGAMLGAGNEGKQDRPSGPPINELTELSSLLEKTIIQVTTVKCDKH